MNDLQRPVAGPARVSAEVARYRVLAQHTVLRQLLTDSLGHIEATLAGEESSRVPLRLLIGVAYETFVAHLAYEEALLFPILEDDLPLGPQRLQRLREEHARQRADFHRLYALRDSNDTRELATRLRRLAMAVLADMEHEERELLTPDVIRDDAVVVDQAGG
jgi:hemerythrin-like domain-containing protein